MKRILVVDDEPDFLDIVRQVLEARGYGVASAADGAAGMAALRADRPDLVILDVNMPVMSGYDVCREIRADPALSDLPVVMLTIRNRDQEIVEGLDCGADEYMAKPFEPRELIARIRNLLERS